MTTTSSDDALTGEVIGLLRTIRDGQTAAEQKARYLESAMLSLNQGFTALSERRLSRLVIAAWGVAGSVLLAGILIAAAIAWGL